MFLETVGKFPSYLDASIKIESNYLNILANTNELFVNNNVTDYLIYEKNLQAEYDRVFSKVLKLREPINNLKKLKSKSRKLKIHYSNYYDYNTRVKVLKAFPKTIEKFKYKFDKQY